MALPFDIGNTVILGLFLNMEPIAIAAVPGHPCRWHPGDYLYWRGGGSGNGIPAAWRIVVGGVDIAPGDNRC